MLWDLHLVPGIVLEKWELDYYRELAVARKINPDLIDESFLLKPRKTRKKLVRITGCKIEFSELLKKERKRQGLTQMQLAEKVGCTHCVICLYEQRTLNRNKRCLKRVVDALNLNIEF